MKKTILFITLAFIGLSNLNAQVGIGTETPETTLDVEGKANDVNVADGFKAPSITLAQLDAKIVAYGEDQNGAIVFVDDVSAGSSEPETNNITETGFYFYDAPNDTWKSVGAGAAPTATLVNDCDANGFEGTFNKDVDSTDRTFSVTVTNNGFESSTISFNPSDLNLSGVSGINVGTPSGSPALNNSGDITLNAGGGVVVTYPLTGEPASQGTLTGDWSKFDLTCTRTVAVNPTPAPMITSLDNCTNPDVTGTLTENLAASGVSADINYSGGNGAPFSSQTVNSTGVTGLTADLSAGNLAFGSGTLTYTISGTPASNGTADFFIDGINGDSCTFSVTVEPASSCTGVTPPVGFNLIEAGGNCWLDRNLGANLVASSSTDAESYGDLYQWGRAKDGHESRFSAETTTQATTAVPNAGNSWDGKFIKGSSSDWLATPDTSLWQGLNGTNNPCPPGFRVPIENELGGLGISDSSDAFSILKMPEAGKRRGYSGNLDDVSTEGYYWSSTVDSGSPILLSFRSATSFFSGYTESTGVSVRCLKD